MSSQTGLSPREWGEYMMMSQMIRNHEALARAEAEARRRRERWQEEDRRAFERRVISFCVIGFLALLAWGFRVVDWYADTDYTVAAIQATTITTSKSVSAEITPVVGQDRVTDIPIARPVPQPTTVVVAEHGAGLTALATVPPATYTVAKGDCCLSLILADKFKSQTPYADIGRGRIQRLATNGLLQPIANPDFIKKGWTLVDTQKLGQATALAENQLGHLGG